MDIKEIKVRITSKSSTSQSSTRIKRDTSLDSSSSQEDRLHPVRTVKADSKLTLRIRMVPDNALNHKADSNSRRPPKYQVQESLSRRLWFQLKSN